MHSPHTDAELEAMMTTPESDLVERKETFDGQAPTTVRQAICAFANDLPGHRQPGVVFIGVDDSGNPTGLEINDALLQKLAHCKTDGNILPLPAMTVSRRTLGGRDVAVVAVTPSDSPPVRFRGRIWTRVGPSRTLASAQDERILNERRRHADAPFDARPAPGARLEDLDLGRFQYLYLPRAFDPEVLQRNDRTVEERLAATKMIISVDDPTPTALGVLMLCARPMAHLPGAYVQFLRIEGDGMADPIVHAERFEGPVDEAVRELDREMRAHNRVSVEIGGGSQEVRRATYALDALRELVRNAVMHRAYEASNSPTRVHWFNDRIEIINPGGPFGDVTANNFGQPGVTGYRNPNLAEAMRVSGLVQRYGAGISLARQALRDNHQSGPEFDVDANWVRVTVRIRSDWPGNTRRSAAS